MRRQSGLNAAVAESFLVVQGRLMGESRIACQQAVRVPAGERKVCCR